MPPATTRVSTASNARAGGGVRTPRHPRSRSTSREGWVPFGPAGPPGTTDLADALRARKLAAAALKARRNARKLEWSARTFHRMRHSAARNIAAAWRGYVARSEATRRRLERDAAAAAVGSQQFGPRPPGAGAGGEQQHDAALADDAGSARTPATTTSATTAAHQPPPRASPPPHAHPVDTAAALVLHVRTLLLDQQQQQPPPPPGLTAGEGGTTQLDITNELFRFVLLALHGTFGPVVGWEAGAFVAALEARLRSGARCCMLADGGAARAAPGACAPTCGGAATTASIGANYMWAAPGTEMASSAAGAFPDFPPDLHPPGAAISSPKAVESS